MGHIHERLVYECILALQVEMAAVYRSQIATKIKSGRQDGSMDSARMGNTTRPACNVAATFQPSSVLSPSLDIDFDLAVPSVHVIFSPYELPSIAPRARERDEVSAE